MISYETDVVSKLNEEQFGEVIRLIHLTSPKQLVRIYEQAKIRKIFLTHAFSQTNWPVSIPADEKSYNLGPPPE